MDRPLRSASFLSIFPGERAVAEYEVLKAPRRLWLMDIPIGLVLLLFPIPILGTIIYAVLVYLLRKERVGYFVVTTQRLGYYERSRNPLGQAHLVYQINLADVIGISTTYEELWFRQTLGFTVLTSYNDNMLIRVTRLFGGVPALAAIFAGSIGDDAFAALPTLYRTVDAVRAGREPLR